MNDKINKRKVKELKTLSDNKRIWHQNFIKYTKFITEHPNYKGLPFEVGLNNKIKWVVTGKSDIGLKRRDWWNEQCQKEGIKIEAGCYAKIALRIHPSKKHVCQICGKELKLEYIYPNRKLINALNKEFKINIKPFSKDIFEIIDDLLPITDFIEKLKRILKIKKEIQLDTENIKDYIQTNFIDKFSKNFFSPGAMSNSPDRLDGFHSDGACCRHKSDKGRHKSNLQRYGQDRRTYENWADGDWKMADRLMSTFRKYGVSADHIGPISCGFCHRPKFQPMTKEQQSAKNNRMSYNDVQKLLNDETAGETVVSWHTKFIWDILKNKVKNDADSKKLSEIMRKNLHHILIIFSMIEENGFRIFLEEFLNSEYSFFDYRFIDFNPKTGDYQSFEQLKREGKNQQNNIKRYFRIAFDSLKDYRNKENRRSKIWNNNDVDREIKNLIVLLKNKNYTEAKMNLEKIFKLLAKQAEINW